MWLPRLPPHSAHNNNSSNNLLGRRLEEAKSLRAAEAVRAEGRLSLAVRRSAPLRPPFDQCPLCRDRQPDRRSPAFSARPLAADAHSNPRRKKKRLTFRLLISAG
jgi:hypothetical protein